MKILNKYPNGTNILQLTISKLKIDWFTDCGEWFLYLYWGKKYIRFSSAGFTRGKL